MATTATLPDREAEELETRSEPPMKWSLQSVSLPVGRLMSSSTNCDVTVSDVVSMIVIVLRTTRALRCRLRDGRAVTWKRPRGDRVRDQYEERAVSTIDATFVTSIAMGGSGVRLPFSGRIRVTK
jgi:hypothetical protein